MSPYSLLTESIVYSSRCVHVLNTECLNTVCWIYTVYVCTCTKHCVLNTVYWILCMCVHVLCSKHWSVTHEYWCTSKQQSMAVYGGHIYWYCVCVCVCLYVAFRCFLVVKVHRDLLKAVVIVCFSTKNKHLDGIPVGFYSTMSHGAWCNTFCFDWLQTEISNLHSLLCGILSLGACCE